MGLRGFEFEDERVRYPRFDVRVTLQGGFLAEGGGAFKAHAPWNGPKSPTRDQGQEFLLARLDPSKFLRVSLLMTEDMKFCTSWVCSMMQIMVRWV